MIQSKNINFYLHYTRFDASVIETSLFPAFSSFCAHNFVRSDFVGVFTGSCLALSIIAEQIL